MRVRSLLIAALALGWPFAVNADVLPSHPITFSDGRLVIGGEASVAVPIGRDTGYFNATDYDHNTLKLFRAGLTASFRASDRVSLLGEIRTENFDAPRAYAWYVRLRPWPNRAIDIQAGRIPPVFGGYSRRRYGQELLIGYPLAYQYLTSLRPDAVPASEQDLLAMRGRGWYVWYPVGSHAYVHGLPLVAAFRWDTGVEMTVDTGVLSLSTAVTTGSLSNPRVRDDNGGKQVVGRLTLRPSAALEIGVSGARGAYLSRTATRALAPSAAGGTYTQDAFGADVEISRDYWLVRGEAVLSRWHLPPAGDFRPQGPLSALALSIEGRYKFHPAFYAAARVDHLGFSRLSVPDLAGQRLPWDAPVTRVEAGGGYQLARSLLGKISAQYNHRDAGYGRSRALASAQLMFWF